MHGSWLFALALLPAAACGGGRAPATPTPAGGTVPAITAADLKTRSYIFADDSMQGRRAGTPGNVRGNAYIASELTRLGLRPGGDDGGYLPGNGSSHVRARSLASLGMTVPSRSARSALNPLP